MKLFAMMKSVPLCLLAIVGVVILLPSCWSKPKKSGLLVVNVLSEPLYDDCHIKGSINVPYGELDTFFEILDPEAQVVFYCSNYMCTSSGYAAKKLKDKGFEHVWAYEGGTAEWYQLGLPTEGPANEAYLKKEISPVERDVPVISAWELAKKMGFK